MSKVFFEYQFTGSYSRVFTYRYSIPDDVTVIANQSEKYSEQPFGTIYNSYAYLYNSNQSIRACFFFDKSCIVTYELYVNGNLDSSSQINCIAQTNGIYTDRYPVGSNQIDGYLLPFNVDIPDLNTGWSYPVTVNYNAGQTFTSAEEAYNYVFNPYVQYQWSSVPAISGKNGILSLATIDNEQLGDGSLVEEGSLTWITNLPSSASIASLTSNLGAGNADVPILWSGNTKRCDATFTFVPIIGNTLILKFYLAPSTGGIENQIFMTGWSNLDYNRSYIGFIKDDENQVAKVSLITTYWDTDHLNEYVRFNDTGSETMTEEQMHDMWVWLEGGTSTDTESDGTDTIQDNDPNGGGGFTPRFNNPIPKPHTPGKSALDTGFISLWYMTETQLSNLASYLWSDEFFDIIEKRLYNDPMDALISLMIFPVTPPHDDVTHPSTLIFGGKTTPYQGQKIHQQFNTIPMGSVEVSPTLEKGVYFDYTPYMSCRIYLPYCGEFELDINEVIGKTLSLEYMVDYFTGVCCAYLTITDKKDAKDPVKGTHYYFTGQMGIKVPVSASDYSGLYNAVVSAGATIGGALAVPASAIASAPVQIGLMANACNNVANMKANVQYTSGGGSISGSLSCEYPYLILSEPKIFEAVNQWDYVGYPCLSTYRINQITGFFKVLETHVENIACTENEREQIRNMLLNGCIRHQGTNIPDSLITPDHDGNYVFLFLKNMSDKNTIGKTFAGENAIDCVKYEGRLLENQSIEKPVLIVNGDVTSYNYVYVPCFNRFYYINDITIKTDKLKFVSCEVDALQSFKSEIGNLECIISDIGDKSKAKLLANNNAWFMEQDKNVITMTFKDEHKRNMGFERGENSGESYILAIAGGNTYTP